MYADRFRFRVHFHDGHPPRDVTARISDGARRTALYAERVTGHRGRLYVARVELLLPVGTHTQASLFTEEATTHEA